MPHADFDELFEALVGFAEQMLDEHGTFHPFAAVVDSDGQINHFAAMDRAAEENESPQKLAALLVEGMRASAADGDIRAAGLCVDVLTIPPGETEKVDAVNIHMEHENGECYDAFVPYVQDEDGEMALGEIFAEEGDASIFPADVDGA